MDYRDRALLPAGFYDTLPPDAHFAEEVLASIRTCVNSYGYGLACPPLMEFETSLLSGAGVALTDQTFRVMDPLSHQMMGVRADMTTQMARIATTRLKNSPLPLRLAYIGDVLRVAGTHPYGARQLTQAGWELFGADSVNADAESVLIALDALKQLGLTELSVDFSMPSLLPLLLSSLPLTDATVPLLKQALIRKDAADVTALAGAHAEALNSLLSPMADSAPIRPLLGKLPLPSHVSQLIDRLDAVIALVKSAAPHVSITIDVLEYHGFEYHTGIAFAIFSKQSAVELGRGGRYTVEQPNNGEPLAAVGCTLYINPLLGIVPAEKPATRVFIPDSTSFPEAATLRKQGYVTVHAVDASRSPKEEALRLACDAYFSDGKVVSVR